MNSVGPGGSRDVGAVVDEQASGSIARESGSARRQLVESACREILFAELDESDARGDGCLDERKQSRGVFTGLTVRGRCRRRQLAARDQIAQWDG